MFLGKSDAPFVMYSRKVMHQLWYFHKKWFTSCDVFMKKWCNSCDVFTKKWCNSCDVFMKDGCIRCDIFMKQWYTSCDASIKQRCTSCDVNRKKWCTSSDVFMIKWYTSLLMRQAMKYEVSDFFIKSPYAIPFYSCYNAELQARVHIHNTAGGTNNEFRYLRAI